MADNINDIIGQELLTRLDTLNKGLTKTVDTMELANREGLQLQETISAAGLSGNFVQLNGTLKQLGPLYDRINQAQREYTATSGMIGKAQAQLNALNTEEAKTLAVADAEKIKASEQDIIFTNQQEISTEAYNKVLAEEEARIMALAEAQGANNIESKQNLQVSQEQVAIVTEQVTKAAQLSKELFLLRDELLMINKALLENNKAFAAGTISESEYIAEQTALTEKQSLTQIQIKETTAALKEQQGVVKSSTDLTDKFGNIVQRMGLRFVANLVIFQAAMNLIEGISKEYEDFQKQQTAVQDGLNAATQKGMDNADELAVKITVLKERFFALNATTEDQKQVTKELGEALGGTAGKMDTLANAEDFFLNKSDAYIQAIQLRAKAQAALAVIVENNSKLLAAELNPDSTAGFLNKAGGVGDALTAALGSFAKPGGVFYNNPLTAAGDAYRQTIKEQGEANVSQLKQTTQSQNDALGKMYLDYIAEAQKLSKQNGFNFNENKDGSSARDHNLTAQRLKNEQELTKLIAEEEAKQIEAQMQTLKLEADNENNTLEDRLLAWRNYQHLKLLAQEAATEAQKKEAKEGLDQIKYIEDHAATEGIDAQDQAILDKKKIFQQQLKNAVADEQYIEAQITRETQEGITKIYEQEFQKRLKLIHEQSQGIYDAADAASKALAEQYEKGEITTEEYNAQLEIIKRNAQREDLESTATHLQALLSFANLSVKDRAEVEKMLSDTKRKIWSDDVDFYKKSVEQIKAENKELFKTGLSELVDAARTAEKIENESTDYKLNELKKRTQAELDQIDQSTLSNEEKSAKKSLINKKEAAEEEELNKKKAAAARRTAIIERIETLANIAMKTQEKVAELEGIAAVQLSQVKTAPLAANTLAQIPIVIAEAAIAGAIVLATPLPPAYASGTESAKGGPAIVGEMGRELVIEPSGKTYLTPGTATLMDIPKASKVITHEETMKMLQSRALKSLSEIGKPVNESIYLQALIKSEKQSKMIVDAIRESESASANKIVSAIRDSNTLPADWGDYKKRIIH